MEELVVQNFKLGLDTRRSEQSSVPGTLVTLLDGHVNEGAEIDKRLAFVKLGTLPAGCFGLQETPNTIYTFGSLAAAGQQALITAAGFTNVTYQQLIPYLNTLSFNSHSGLIASGCAMTSVVWSCSFGGLPFVIATFAAGLDYSGATIPATTQLFYNGNFIRSLSAGTLFNKAYLDAQFLDAITSDYPPGFLAEYSRDTSLAVPSPDTGGLVDVYGAPNQVFSIVASDSSGSNLLQAIELLTTAQAAAGQYAYANLYILSCPTGGGNSIGLDLTEVGNPAITITNAGSDSLFTLATKFAAAWNAWAGSPGNNAPTYVAVAIDSSVNYSTVRILAPAVDLTNFPHQPARFFANGSAQMARLPWGAVTTGGAHGLAAFGFSLVSQGGLWRLDFQPTAAWPATATYEVQVVVGTLTYDYGSGNLSGLTPTFCWTQGQKVNLLAGSTWAFSALGDATLWENQDIGAGSIVVSDLNDSDAQQLIAGVPYQGRASLFSPFQVQIWSIASNPSSYAQQQILENVGSVSTAPRGIGDLDVFFPDPSGVRSLRVRDSSLNGFTIDIGSPVNLPIQADILATGGVGSCSVVEPVTGHYWLFINGHIWVLSYYPNIKINAWSEYSPTYFNGTTKVTFVPTKMLIWHKKVYLLCNDNSVLIYGGTNGLIYDKTQCVIAMPWLDHKRPSMKKQSLGIDAAITGQWNIYATANPYDNNLDYPSLPPNLVLQRGSATAPDVNRDSSFDWYNYPFHATGTHIKIVAVSGPYATAAKLSSLVWKYNPAQTK